MAADTGTEIRVFSDGLSKLPAAADLKQLAIRLLHPESRDPEVELATKYSVQNFDNQHLNVVSLCNIEFNIYEDGL